MATQFFANGVDVFGRPPKCRGCHEIVGNMKQALEPRVAEFKAARERRESRRRSGAVTVSHYGVLEDLVEETIAGACRFGNTYHVPQARKACEKLLEAMEDEIVAAYVAHGKRPQDAAFDPNWEVCYEATRACTKELASHPLSDFTDDMEFESGDASAAYTSEVMPSWSDGDGVLLDTDRRAVRKVVAGSFLQDVILSDEAERLDVLLYLSFPFSNKEFHESAMPAFARLGAVIGGSHDELEHTCGGSDMCREAAAALTGRVILARINVDNNELAPPHGDNIDGPAMAHYPAGSKGMPKFMSNNSLDGRLTVYDLLFFLMHTTATPVVARAAAVMSREARREALYYRAWDDEDRLSGDPLPFEWDWTGTPESDLSGRIEL